MALAIGQSPIKDGLRCATCGATNLRVIDTRLVVRTQAVRRSRECLDCGNRTTSYEISQKTYERYEQMARDLKRIGDLAGKTTG